MSVIESRVANCLFCKHLEEGFKCAAFPNGIPDIILSGEDGHLEPYEQQENEVVFEPID